MTWKSPLVKASADMLVHRRGIVRRLLMNEEVAAMAAGELWLLREMFGPEGPWRKLLENTRVRSQVGLDGEVVKWADPKQVLLRLSADELLDLLDVADARGVLSVRDRIRHLGPERVLRHIALDQLLANLNLDALCESMDAGILLRHVSAEQMLVHLDPARMLEHLGPEPMLEYLSPERMLESLGPERMLEHLGADRMLEYLGPDRMLESLGPERMLEHLGPERMLDHLSPDRMLEYLDPELLLEFLGPERMLERLGPERMLEYLGPERMLEHLGPERMLEHLDPELLLEFLGPERMLQYLGPQRILQHLGLEQTIEFLGPEQVLEYLGPARMLKFLGPERMLEYLSTERLLESRGAERVIEYIGVDLVFESLGPERMLAHLGTEQVLASLRPDDIIKHLGTDRILAALTPEQMIKHLGAERSIKLLSVDEVARHVPVNEFLDKADPDGQRLATYVAEQPAAAEALGKNTAAMKQLLVTPHVRQKLRVLNAIEKASALPYPLPAVVLSYPRSGSNFLQSILIHSTGMFNVSLYSVRPCEQVPLLTVKSHALSPAYLLDEFDRLLGRATGPGRIILVKRDPRDVMISFYEYTMVNRQAPIDQAEFLKNIDFFYASTVDKTYSRRVEKGPLSVLQAYKKHVREWFSKRPDGLDVLEVRYEDLVMQPQSTFRAVLDYLALDMPVAEEFLDAKVSLYSQEDRPRGVPHSWQLRQDEYQELLEGVTRLLSKEIQLLGYDTISDASRPPKAVIADSTSGKELQ